MSQTIDQVFRDYRTAGVPASGEHEPDKREIRALLKMIQNSGGQAVTRNTLSALNGVTPPTEDYMGVVLADPTASNNGYYYRSGSAWVFGRHFSDTFAEVALSGSGTAQTGAINTGVNPSGVEVFFARVTTPNTGPMTLSISGETTRDVVNLAGNPLSAGEWTGMVMFYLNEDGDYQLLIDAGAAAAAAQSATNAAASATAAAAFGVVNFDDVADLLADNNDVIGYAGSGASVEVASGFRLSAGGFSYDVADSAVTDKHVETAGGVALYLRRNADLTVYSEQAGITAATTSAAAINKMLSDALAAGARTVKMAKGEWAPDDQIIWPIGLKEIDWQDSTLTQLSAVGGDNSAIRLNGVPTVLPALVSNVGQRTDNLQFATPHGLQVGDVVGIRNTTVSSLNTWRSYYYDGEVNVVREVSTSTRVELMFTADPRGPSNLYPFATCEVTLFPRELSGLALRNLRVMGNLNPVRMLRLRGMTNFELENIVADGGSSATLVLENAAFGRGEGLVLNNSSPASGTNYGISHSSVSHFKTFGTVAYGTRHALAHGSGDGVASLPPRNNEHHGVTLGSRDYAALDFGHGNVLDHRCVGGTIEGVAIGGSGNTVDVELIKSTRNFIFENQAVSGANFHDMNHTVRASRVLLTGNGRLEDGVSPSPQGAIGFGGTGTALSSDTQYGGVLKIDVGVLEARRWVEEGAPLTRFRNRGFTGRWGVDINIRNVLCPSEPEWFLCDAPSGTLPSVVILNDGPDRTDTNSPYVDGWNKASRGFTIPAGMPAGSIVRAPVLVGAATHAGGSLAAGAQALIAVTGFAGLNGREALGYGVSGPPGYVSVTPVVGSASVVYLVVTNLTASSISLPALTWYAYVEKRP